MAQDIVIRGNTYNDAPAVEIPRADGQGDALFYDTSDATITGGGQMLDGVISYGASGKVTGSIPTKTSANLSASGATVTAQAGYYATSASKSVANGSAETPVTSITANPTITISSGGLITASVSASQSVTPTVTAGYVSSGTAGTVSVSGSNTSQMTVQGAQTITPTTSNQTIASGTYLTGTQTIAGDPNLVAGNIVDGVTIFNTTGNVKVPVVVQDSVTKILSIS